jgi:hypothetical protein
VNDGAPFVIKADHSVIIYFCETVENHKHLSESCIIRCYYEDEPKPISVIVHNISPKETCAVLQECSLMEMVLDDPDLPFQVCLIHPPDFYDFVTFVNTQTKKPFHTILLPSSHLKNNNM